MAESDGCTLCDLPLSETAVEDQAGRAFCCRGCRGVYETLGDVESVSEDDVREALDDRGTATDRTGTTDDAVPDGHERTFLKIEGMHCATCEAFIEARLGEVNGVSDAEASYVTETVRVDFDPERQSEDELIEAVSGLGYTAFRRGDSLAERRAEDWLQYRLIVGVVFGMMVMLQYVTLIYPLHFDVLYSDASMELLRQIVTSGPSRYFFAVVFLFTSVVLFGTGAPILRGAYVSLRARQPNMDLLVAVAAVSAYLYSTLAVLLGRIDVYYDVTVAIVLVVTAGNYYERAIKREATDRLSDLTVAQVDEARRYEGDDTDDGGLDSDAPTSVVDVDDLEAGDPILVREGERVPVDGTVVDGEGTVDEAVVTGESLPVVKQPDDQVVGGGIVTEGALVIDVDDAPTSSLDRITDLVWNLQSSSHGVQKLADRLAAVFVPAVATIALLAAAGTLLLGAGPTGALLVGLTVLIVSCPCALGLATPLAVASSVRAALDRGIVVFDDTVFERLRDVDTVVFDKTGTLTTGDMEVLEADGPDEAFALAAALERRSSHPVAEAITDAFEGGGVPDDATAATDGGETTAEEPATAATVSETGDRVSEFESHPTGVSGVVDGVEVLVGRPDLFSEQGWELPTDVTEQAAESRAFGRLPVVVGRDGRAEGVAVVGDEPREGWTETLASLDERGVDVVVLTGDDERAAEFFGEHSAVDEVFARVPPEGKAATVRRLGADGRTVMVGDGTNDAPALARADLGIAMGGGTALAADAADVAIVTDDLGSIETVFDLSRAAGRRVKQNIGWAFGYNAVAIPLAVTGLLNPLFAAVAMASSSLLVVTNSARSLLADEE